MKTYSLTKSFLSTIFLVAALPLLAQDIAEKVVSDDEKIIKISDEACECTRDISVEISKDSIVRSINNCITSAIIEEQTKQQLSNMEELIKEAVEAKTDTVIGEDKTYTIVANKNFDKIQAYMYKNCNAVKSLMTASNEKSDKSMSKKKKALEYYQEGQTYDSQKKFDMAIVSYSKAVKIDPKFVFAWDNLGLAHRKMGNYNEAIKCYKKSLEIDSRGRVPLMNIGSAYEKLEDYKSAGECFVKMITTYPNDPEGYFGAGRIFYISQDYEKGVDYMFKAYLLYSENQSPYIHDAEQNLAYYYQDLEQKGKLDIFMQAAKNNNINIQDEEE